MNIKRFLARNSQEALRMVKREMGPDAVILETRSLPGEDMGTASKVEVTAAVDYEASTRVAGEGSSGQDTEGVDAKDQWKEGLRDLRQLLEVIEAGSVLQPELYFNETLKRRYSLLRNIGLNPGTIRELMADMGPAEGSGASGKQSQVRECLFKVIRKVRFDKERKSERPGRIYSFIGPTGVGKTTTLAKLAALNTVRLGRKVALISVDTFRIAAVAQMETYARIMSVPLEIAASRNELEYALRKHQGCDVIFIDTAGRSPNNHKEIAQMGEVFQIDREIHHYLVLSATTEFQSLLAADKRFGILPFQSYIFTKLDETEDSSAMLNFLVSRPKPVSYFTTGQQVPEDIEPASKKRLASIILNRKGVIMAHAGSGVN